jgi:hypothetical protein
MRIHDFSSVRLPTRAVSGWTCSGSETVATTPVGPLTRRYTRHAVLWAPLQVAEGRLTEHLSS